MFVSRARFCMFRFSPTPSSQNLLWLMQFLAVCVTVTVLSFAQPATTIRVSVNSDGSEGDGFSNRISISASGRVVAFHSVATNLVPGDTNDNDDVFVRDLEAGLTTRVSVNSQGIEGNLGSSSPAISGNGRYVAFVSNATNLVSGDTNNTGDVFVHDRLTGATSRVSVSSNGEEGNAISWGAMLSPDGRYVYFLSDASNLDADDPNGNRTDRFVHDRVTGETSRIKLGPPGVGPDDLIRGGTVSDDNSWIAFNTAATNIVEGDTNGLSDCFVHNLDTGEPRRISVGPSGEEVDQPCQRARISGDGRFVVFDSEASNLVEGDTNGLLDIFLYGLETGETSRITLGQDGAEANGMSRNAVLSFTGRYASFFSAATNLVPNDTNQQNDVFRLDLLTGDMIRVSLGQGGEQGDVSASYPHMSEDGSEIIFQSSSTNLVPDDTNGVIDVFLRQIHSNELYFAQFGEGADLLSSQIVLLNPSAEAEVRAVASLRTSEGEPLTVDLNGNEVIGEAEEQVLGPSGVLVLQTDGLGPITVGSVTVRSDWPLEGVIIFGGAVGLAGVGSSPSITRGFIGPVETKREGPEFAVRTGVAVMNLDVEPVTLSIWLRNAEGYSVDMTQAVLSRRGQVAKYVDELDWPTDVVFSDFVGSILVVPSGPIAATLLQTRPGQFATVPVIPVKDAQ